MSVWNPAYADDAMDATVALLLRHVQAHRSHDAEEDDVYVWWGKVRSANRQQPMKHLDEIVALDSKANLRSMQEGSQPSCYRSAVL